MKAHEKNLKEAWEALRQAYARDPLVVPDVMARMGDAVAECLNDVPPQPRICAHSVPMETYRTHVVFTQTFKDGIAKHYKDNPAGYTHVDVYSPPEVGERLLYRVQL